MKLIITGGLGFIGINFINFLINDSKNIILNIDRQASYSTSNDFLSFKSYNNYYFKKKNICEYKEIEKIIFNFEPDIIFHLAAESHVDRSITDPINFIQSNILGTYNLLHISEKYFRTKNKNFKFLYVSTDEVYGSLELKDNKLFDENCNFLPNSPYSASKASGDLLVRAWNKTFGLPTLTTHCSNNYGPWQYPEKLIPLIIKKILNKDKIPIYGDGLNIRDWIDVFDHVKALFELSKLDFNGQVYNIGSNNLISNIDLAKKICKIMDTKMKSTNNSSDLIEFVRDRKGHDLKYAINSSKLYNDINFKSSQEFVSNLSKTLDWYLLNKDWLFRKINKML